MLSSAMSDMKQTMRSIWNAQYRVWAGLAFMALALVAIQYDEVLAPKVSGFSDGFGAIASDMSRRITSFTL